MNILFIIGTRPEAIKISPLILECYNRKNVNPFVLLTGQHADMVIPVLNLFGIYEYMELPSRQTGQSNTDLVSILLHEINKCISQIRTDYIVIQGDTISAFAGALSGFLSKTKVVHVEAGLRSFDKFNPWPEESIRKMISNISDIHFSPTTQSKQNLIREGVSADDIIVSGNTVIDSLRLCSDKIEKMNYHSDTISFTNADNTTNILVTSHRRENIPYGITALADKLIDMSHDTNFNFILPMHPNPEVRNIFIDKLSSIENIKLSEPLSYYDLIYTLKNIDVIISDSGGIQEEAPFFGKRVLVNRNSTERNEVLESGHVILVGSNCKDLNANLIYESAKANLVPSMVYGDGYTSKVILDKLSMY